MTSRAIGGLLHHTAFLNGAVRPHEKTLIPRLQRQEELVLPDKGALGKPILLTVPSLKNWWVEQDKKMEAGGECLDLVGKDNNYTLRDYSFKAHSFLPDPLPTGVSLDKLGPIVIADGHHRAETHAKLGQQGIPGFEYVPVCLIGADELHIGVFARIITAATYTGNDLLRLLEQFFTLTPIAEPLAPRSTGEWLLVHKGQHFRLNCTSNPDNLTDVEWLNSVFLPECYGITDVRTDDRIYFEPIEEAVDGLIADQFPAEATTLVCHSIPKERFFAEVEAGQVLPPKSTRFEPRIPSGLMVWIP